MLVVSVASTDADLTTTGYVKSVMGTTSTADDARISLAIRAASRWAESYLQRPLSVQTYRETVPSFNRRNLVFSRYPMRAVAALYAATDTGEAVQLLSSEFRVESADAGLVSRDEGWEWTAPVETELTLRPLPGQERKPWMADYVAGYTYGGVDTGSANWSTEQGSTSTGRTLPEDIEEAVALRAANIYENTAGLIAETLGDLKVEYRPRFLKEEVVEPWELLLETYRSF